MKTRNFILAAFLMAATLIFSFNSCNEKEPEPQPEPEPAPAPIIQLESETLEVPEEGGTYTLTYSIENPVEGTELTVSCEADFVTDLTCDDAAIGFKVTANDGDARTAEIDIRYGETGKIFTINQAAMTEKVEAEFEITVKDITETSALYSIIPKDKEMQYLTFILTAEEIEAKGLTDDEALWQSDLEFLKADAESYGEILEQTIGVYSYTGDLIDMMAGGLIPGQEVVIYAYGVKASGNEATRLTDIVRYHLTPLDVEKSDITFSISCENTPEGMQRVNVTPENGYDGWYFFDVLSLAEGEDAEQKAISTWYLNRQLMLQFGTSLEDILKSVGSQGPDSHEYSLDPGNHTIIAAALNDKALITSNKITYIDIQVNEEGAVTVVKTGR